MRRRCSSAPSRSHSSSDSPEPRTPRSARPGSLRWRPCGMSDSPAPPAIVVRDVEKAYEDGRIRALNGMSMTVEEGEWVAIVGPSGCGKSTLLHLVAALDHPDAGHIHVHGNDLDRVEDAALYRRRSMGLVFQLHNLLPSLTAAENVEVPMFGARAPLQARPSSL